MKKTIFILLAFLLLLSMGACGNTNLSETLPIVESESSQQTTSTESNRVTEQDKTTESEIPAVEPLELEEVYQNILTSINAGDDFILFPESNPNIMDELYEGLSGVELNQSVFYIHPITGFACEIMLVEVANETDLQTVIDIFEGRIALGTNETFYAETAALWKTNAQVQTFGNYVCMIALPEGYEIPENVFAE